MIAPYLLRLVCVSLAAFLLINLAAGLLVKLAARAMMGAVHGIRPATAARVLFALRLLPAALALFVVFGLFIPSYLWLEPEFAEEEIQADCIAAALLGAALWLAAAVRGARGITRARRHARECRRIGRRQEFAGSQLPVWMLDTPAPLCVLIGVFRPGVLLSAAVVHKLTPAQLDVALRHEAAHFRSRDNLKRLLLLFTPSLLPGISGFREIERAWARLSEWAADDEAASGDNRRSLSLASALVRMARMGGTAATPLTASLVPDCGEVWARVDRLLQPAPPVTVHRPRWTLYAPLALAPALALLMLNPATLAWCHTLIERLVH